MEMQADKTQKKPFNPYYLPAYYLAYSWLIAALILSLPDNASHRFFLFCQSFGAESLALFMRRYNSMHEYLLKTGDALRWERIVMMLYFCLIGLFASSLIWIKTVMSFLRWWTGTKETWNLPIPYEIKKMTKKISTAIIFVLLFEIGSTFIYINNWQSPTNRGIYHIATSNLGFFGLGIDLTIIFLALQACHFIGYRLHRDQ